MSHRVSLPKRRRRLSSKSRCGHSRKSSIAIRKEHQMNANDILKYGQGTVHQAIEGLPESAWDTPGACGVWSIKDIIAHLTSYEHVMVDVLGTFVSSVPTAYLNKFTDPDNNFNDSEVAARKGKTAREVLGEFNDTHKQVMSLGTRFPMY